MQAPESILGSTLTTDEQGSIQRNVESPPPIEDTPQPDANLIERSLVILETAFQNYDQDGSG